MSAAAAEFVAACQLLQKTARLLDEEKFDEWLNLFDADGRYELSAYSTEIRRWMTWQLSDRAALEKLLKDIDAHVRDPARRRHVVGMPLVEIDADSALMRSHFSLFRTTPDGQTSLYLVGSYEDRIVKRMGEWLYLSHKVVVDTRVLDTFTHVPI